MLQDANAYLIALRAAGDGDAAGLVVCVDCEHADRITRHMAEHVIRSRPVVACSRSYDANDPDPADAIYHFDRAYDPWIVAVNMISEGVDIRRLRVVVYLTNRMTSLSFRQIVGRVVRSDPANAHDQGRIYIAADPRLLGMAHTITYEVDLLPPPMIIETEPATTVTFPCMSRPNPHTLSSRCFRLQASKEEFSTPRETSPMQTSSIEPGGSFLCTS